MNPFAAIEDACAQFVERTFARIFPSDVAPAQIARKLVATMESAPAETYLVRLHPRDLASLHAERAELEREWSALLERTTSALGLTIERSARVILHADESLVAGTVAIDPVQGDEQEASARGYAIRVKRGVPLGAAWPIEGTISIGRGSEDGIDLVDPRVSRRHARLTRTDEGVIVEDAGSTNGTQVNGIRISGPTRLVPGDVVILGDTELRVEIGDG
jgi:hypothetical protein